MLVDLFESFRDHAVRASEPSIQIVDNGATQLIVVPGQVPDYRPIPRTPFHHVRSLDSFLRAIAEWGKGGSVWHGADECVLIGENPRNLVMWKLQTSAAWNALSSPALDQAAFIQLLRHNFRDGGDEVDALIPKLRKLEFRRRNDGRAEVQHGKESLGRSVEQSVQAVEDLPEDMRVMVRIYDEPSITVAPCFVLCQLLIDVAKETFRLLPLAGAMQAVMSHTQDWLHDALEEGAAEAGVPVFYGSPEFH